MLVIRQEPLPDPAFPRNIFSLSSYVLVVGHVGAYNAVAACHCLCVALQELLRHDVRGHVNRTQDIFIQLALQASAQQHLAVEDSVKLTA